MIYLSEVFQESYFDKAIFVAKNISSNLRETDFNISSR